MPPRIEDAESYSRPYRGSSLSINLERSNDIFFFYSENVDELE